MKSMVFLVSIAFVVVSCATPGREPELTKQPEFPALEEAMDKIAESLPAEGPMPSEGDRRAPSVSPSPEFVKDVMCCLLVGSQPVMRG